MKYPNHKTMLRRMKKACDRNKDGDLREATFVVPPEFHLPGLLEKEKKFQWTDLITLVVEVRKIHFKQTIKDVRKVYFKFNRC